MFSYLLLKIVSFSVFLSSYLPSLSLYIVTIFLKVYNFSVYSSIYYYNVSTKISSNIKVRIGTNSLLFTTKQEKEKNTGAFFAVVLLGSTSSFPIS
jgi:hypothetical protein